jgi:dihydroxyacetone kinase
VNEFGRVLHAVAEAVSASADDLNRLDGQAGDGDLGVTMRTASTIVLDLLPGLEGRTLPEHLRECGLALARGAPSTAGTLVATGLLRAAREAEMRPQEPPSMTLALLLGAAATGIAERGRAAVGSRTMLDALVPASEAAERSAAAGEAIERSLARAADAANEGARATAAMEAVHGRAGWLAQRAAGHEDAGARLIAIALRAAADATSGAPSGSASAAAKKPAGDDQPA